MKSFATVAKMLAERLGVEPDTITPDTKLESLGADSLSVIELIFDLEDTFGVKMGDERPTLVVVQDIADIVDALVANKPQS